VRYTPRKISMTRNVSQIPRTAGPMLGKRLFGEAIELAGFGIPLNGAVETTSFIGLEPRAETRELSLIQPLATIYHL
jgi:hypothetical protein